MPNQTGNTPTDGCTVTEVSKTITRSIAVGNYLTGGIFGISTAYVEEIFANLNGIKVRFEDGTWRTARLDDVLVPEVLQTCAVGLPVEPTSFYQWKWEA